MNEVSAAKPNLARGDVIAGKYRIDRELARGGMGIIWVARHEMLRQDIAVKTLLSEAMADPKAIERFTREARAAAMLTSDHVVRVFDVGFLPSGLPYLAMEKLEGRDLASELASRGPLPVAVACDYVVQALEAIIEAHAHGIVHRDLKLSNLFLAKRSNGGERVKVLDFGISKFQAEEKVEGDLTSTRDVLGSPAYMSPEQLRTPRAVDTRTDIWSVGVILYELLSGTSLFGSEESVGDIFAKILSDPIRPLKSVKPDIPDEIDRVVMRCLDRNRQTRVQTASELWNALAPYAPPPSSTKPQSFRVLPVASNATVRDTPTLAAEENRPPPEAERAAPSTPPRPRSARVVGLAAGLLLLVVACGVFALGTLRRASPPAANGELRADTSAAATVTPEHASASATTPPLASATTPPPESTVAQSPTPLLPARALASTPAPSVKARLVSPPPARSPAPRPSSVIAAPLRGRE
jgi:serine/threonine-protein kinase